SSICPERSSINPFAWSRQDAGAPASSTDRALSGYLLSLCLAGAPASCRLLAVEEGATAMSIAINNGKAFTLPILAAQLAFDESSQSAQRPLEGFDDDP